MQFGDGMGFFPETLGSSLPGEHSVLIALWDFSTLQVQKSSVFRRNGADIHSDLLISVAQAVLGGTARCQGLYETINITVSTSTGHGSVGHSKGFSFAAKVGKIS